VISGYAQRLEEELDKADPLQQDVQAILAEIPRLAAVAERMRSLGGVPAAPAAPQSAYDCVLIGGPSRILLVEDESAIRGLLRQALERCGYRVEVACTGAEGLALCDAIEPPDLLITI
jgi:PleD family two-component response regulator